MEIQKANNSQTLNTKQNKFTAYKKAVIFVESFKNTSTQTNPGIYVERTKHFLHTLGNPEKFLNIIHVTGTAGKGTVSTTIHNVLVQAGYTAGLFTSPHVTTTIEKIKVGKTVNGTIENVYIPPNDFVRLVNKLKPFIQKLHKSRYGTPTSFEVLLVIALIYFKEQKCSHVVLEAGVGGRYDATNVCQKPLASVITNIDYDHTDILGKTLEKIAYDKAGIIKQSVPFFTAEQRHALLTLFKKICKAHNTKLIQSRTRSNKDLIKKIFETLSKNKVLTVTKQDIEQGINLTKLPCRFEVMPQQNSNVETRVILDGAHNRSKMKYTVKNLQAYIKKHPEHKRLCVVVALTDAKDDHVAALKEIIPRAAEVIVTSVSQGNRRSLSAEALMPFVKKYVQPKTKICAIEDPHQALEYAQLKATKPTIILASGSFFLAGALREYWYSEEVVLKKRSSFFE